MLQSQQNLLLIVMPINGLKQLGYARLDCLSLETATITVVLSPAFQGKGLGVRVIRRVCEMGFTHWQHLHQILAVIRSENLRSLAAFKKAGFTQADQAFQQPDHHVLMIRRSSQPQPSTQHAHCERLEDGR
jgi:RimJ/RimL family protein N-acetyltransferase